MPAYYSVAFKFEKHRNFEDNPLMNEKESGTMGKKKHLLGMVNAKSKA